MTEQFVFDEIEGDGSAVDGNEGAMVSGTEMVHSAGGETGDFADFSEEVLILAEQLAEDGGACDVARGGFGVEQRIDGGWVLVIRDDEGIDVSLAEIANGAGDDG